MTLGPSSGRDALIVEAVRTPIGRGNSNGAFRSLHPARLLGGCYVDLLRRSKIPPEFIDNVVVGCVYQVGEQSGGIARLAWLQEGLPETTGAMTVDLRCGSGQQAVIAGALQVATGLDDMVIAGGVEHMGRVGFPVNEGAQRQWGSPVTAELTARHELVSQGVAADLIADQWAVTREEMDRYSLLSHIRAATATQEGLFARELSPVATDGITVSVDE
jgi:acetyl-CoA acetyltransferase